MIGWTSRIRVPAVILSERETRGVQLVGIDPQDERTISFLGDVAVRGEPLTDRNDSRLLLGAALAAQLNTGVGRRVVVMTQGADGKNREAGFRIAGLFDADGVGLEKAFVFTGLRPLQKMLDTAAVTEVSVRLRDDRFSAAADRSLKKEMDGLDVMTWRELEPQAAAMFVYADVGILIWFIIMMLALAFGLINTLIAAVLERVQELGMLRALGMRSGAVMVQVVIESLLIVVFGLVCGIVLGMGLIGYLSDGIDLSRWSAGVELAGLHTVLMPKFMIRDVVTVSLLSLLLGLFASAYPAWRAVRIKPLDALRR
jgi:ABC-type lipoprotein release transport system permease subunit